MYWNHTLYSDVDCVAELFWYRHTPVHCITVLVSLNVACWSSHYPPDGAGWPVSALTWWPHHSPVSRVSLTAQWDRVRGEVLSTVRTHCERCWWVNIWKTTCDKRSNRAQRSTDRKCLHSNSPQLCFYCNKIQYFGKIMIYTLTSCYDFEYTLNDREPSDSSWYKLQTSWSIRLKVLFVYESIVLAKIPYLSFCVLC